MTLSTRDLHSDIKVMGLVGSAHGASHFFHLVLPPLFPILKEEFGVTYSALALLTTLFYGVSGIAQTLAGFFVDRYGARNILLSGLTLLSLSVIGYGLASEFWMLLLFAVLAGLGNSVFHPADLSILTQKVTSRRLGKAYGIHAFSGNVGWAAAPVFVISVTQLLNWQYALILAGFLGLSIVLFFIIFGSDLNDNKGDAKTPLDTSILNLKSLFNNLSLLFSPTILSCFCFFALLAAALIGVQSFGVSAIGELYEIDITQATFALTTFLVCSAFGILSGGVLADKTTRHDIIAIAGVSLSGLVLLLIGSQIITASSVIPLLGLSGFFSGVTAPSRDMLVKKATPSGSTGRIFGFVYSGLDLGSSLMPLLLGWLMDIGNASYVFYVCAIMLFGTTSTVINVKRRSALPSKKI